MAVPEARGRTPRHGACGGRRVTRRRTLKPLRGRWPRSGLLCGCQPVGDGLGTGVAFALLCLPVAAGDGLAVGLAGAGE